MPDLRADVHAEASRHDVAAVLRSGHDREVLGAHRPGIDRKVRGEESRDTVGGEEVSRVRHAAEEDVIVQIEVVLGETGDPMER